MQLSQSVTRTIYIYIYIIYIYIYGTGQVSEEFGVGMGLRQSCILSPLLFVYINSVVTRLHDRKCGVQCGGDMVPGLLFAGDTSLVASDKEGLEKSLDVLVKWCEE